MNSLTPRNIIQAPEVRRRGFVTLVTLMAVGALLAMLALSSTTVPTTVTMAPAAAPDGSSTASTATGHSSATASVPASTEPGAQTSAGQTAGGTEKAASASEPTHPVTMQPVTSSPCGGLQAAVDAFMQHLNAAHLETSPGQQVADALNVDQYIKTHTVLIGNMLKPLLSGTTSAMDAFLQHVYAAHLEASPGQQAADALAVDQYIKTHTVMVENMLKPLAGTNVSSC